MKGSSSSPPGRLRSLSSRCQHGSPSSPPFPANAVGEYSPRSSRHTHDCTPHEVYVSIIWYNSSSAPSHLLTQPLRLRESSTRLITGAVVQKLTMLEKNPVDSSCPISSFKDPSLTCGICLVHPRKADTSRTPFQSYQRTCRIQKRPAFSLCAFKRSSSRGFFSQQSGRSLPLALRNGSAYCCMHTIILRENMGEQQVSAKEQYLTSCLSSSISF